MIVNPVPGSSRKQNDGGYPADSGLDILVPVGTPVVAIARGRIVYSEVGHTPWWEDTDPVKPGFQPPYSVLLELAEPFEAFGKLIRFAWYTHLTAVEFAVADGSGPVEVNTGQKLGLSGVGNRVPHVHFGLLTDRRQGAGQFLSDRQVAELVWPTKIRPASIQDPSAEPPAAHEPRQKLKVFAHSGKVRAFHGGEEVPAAAVKVFYHSDKLGVTINGRAVNVDALELVVSYRP